MAVVQTPQGGMSVAPQNGMSIAPQATLPQVPVAKPEQTTPAVEETSSSPIVKFGTATKLFSTPTTSQNPVQQASDIVNGKTLLDLYNAGNNTPSKDAIKQQVLDSGYRQQLDDIKAQQYALAKQMTAPMTDIYADPEVMKTPGLAAQKAKTRMQMLAQRMDMLNGFSDRLNKEAEAATEMSYNQQVKENEKIKNATDYLKALKDNPDLAQQAQVKPLTDAISGIDNLWANAGQDTSQGIAETIMGQMNPSLDPALKQKAAQDVLQQAGINTNFPISQLTEDQLAKIKSVQLKNSNPEAYKKLEQSGAIKDGVIDSSKISQQISSTNAFSQLSPEQSLQAGAILKSQFGAKNAEKPEYKQAVAKMMLEGKTADEIQDSLRTGAFGVGFSGAIKNAFNAATIKVPASDRGSQQENLEDLISEYGVQSPETQGWFKSMIQSQLPAATSEKVWGKETTNDSLLAIKDKLRQYEAKGGDTNLFSGKIEDLFEKVGLVRDTELRDIAQEIAIAVQTYRQQISGAAFTESESKEYKSVFPSIDNVDELNTTKINAILNSNDRFLKSIYSQKMGGIQNYEEIFGTDKKIEESQPQSNGSIFKNDYGIFSYPTPGYILKDVWNGLGIGIKDLIGGMMSQPSRIDSNAGYKGRL